jgi:hypothetical protein
MKTYQDRTASYDFLDLQILHQISFFELFFQINLKIMKKE